MPVKRKSIRLTKSWLCSGIQTNLLMKQKKKLLRRNSWTLRLPKRFSLIKKCAKSMTMVKIHWTLKMDEKEAVVIPSMVILSVVVVVDLSSSNFTSTDLSNSALVLNFTTSNIPTIQSTSDVWIVVLYQQYVVLNTFLESTQTKTFQVNIEM